MLEGESPAEPAEQFTQEDDACTQMEPFNEEEGASQGMNGDVTGQRAWARLISLAKGSNMTELLPRPAKQGQLSDQRSLMVVCLAVDHLCCCMTADGGPCNIYYLGRGKMCDVRLQDARVSSEHCRIFCEEVREAGRLTLKAYVEDNSSNGTFINGDVRLRKVGG